MSNWRKLPISERYNIWKLYQDAYPEMSHRDMIKHFDGGGIIGEKEQNEYTKSKKITNEEYSSSFFDRPSLEETTSMVLNTFLGKQSEKLGDDYRRATDLPLSDIRHIDTSENGDWHTLYEPKGKPYLWRQYVDKTYPLKHFVNGGTIGWPPVRRKWDEDSQEFVDVPYAPEKEPSILKATKVDPYIVDKFGNYKDPHKIRMFTSIDDANIGIRKNIRQGTVNQSNIWPMKDYQEFENIELDTRNSNKVFWP